MEFESNEIGIFNNIKDSYNKNGFVTNELISDLIAESNISLSDVEYFIQKIIDVGILIIDKNGSDDYITDYAFHDYNKIYNEILEISTEYTYLVNYINSIKPPQKHEFDNLYIEARNGNNFAKSRIVEMNLRLAVRHALYFHKKYNCELDETIAISIIGLILGYEKYDVDKPLKYQNHIQWWIRQALYREIDIGNIYIKFPAHLKEQLFKISYLFRNKKTYYIYENKIKLIHKIKNILNCSTKNAFIYWNSYLQYIPFDEIKEYDKKYLEYDLIDELDESLTNFLLKIQLNITLSTLPGRENAVIQLRFGLNGHKIQTLDEIGTLLGITRERVRQIESKALRRLRHPKRCKRLMMFFDYNIPLPIDKDLPKNKKFIKK
jgi:RNA polymerase primary sigma factor